MHFAFVNDIRHYLRILLATRRTSAQLKHDWNKREITQLYFSRNKTIKQPWNV